MYLSVALFLRRSDSLRLSLWSDQCCLSLQCSNQCNTSQTQLHPEKTQQPLYKHMSIIPHCRSTSKSQWYWNQRKNTKASFFLLSFLPVKIKKKLTFALLACLVVVWDAPFETSLTETLESDKAEAEMRLKPLIRPIGEIFEFVHMVIP